jgi:predicted ribosome quality control (RQC) complex YloA/Tae2 family protein
MRKDDIYLHADYHGAASTILRNHKPSLIVPRASLDEAAVYSLCRSKAWDAKVFIILNI